jgi:hypothetical protein
MKKSAAQKFTKLCKAHGLTVEPTKGGHIAIKKNGNLVVVAASTARRGFEDAAYELSKLQLLPIEVRRINFN